MKKEKERALQTFCGSALSCMAEAAVRHISSSGRALRKSIAEGRAGKRPRATARGAIEREEGKWGGRGSGAGGRRTGRLEEEEEMERENRRGERRRRKGEREKRRKRESYEEKT